MPRVSGVVALLIRCVLLWPISCHRQCTEKAGSFECPMSEGHEGSPGSITRQTASYCRSACKGQKEKGQQTGREEGERDHTVKEAGRNQQGPGSCSMISTPDTRTHARTCTHAQHICLSVSLSSLAERTMLISFYGVLLRPDTEVPTKSLAHEHRLAQEPLGGVLQPNHQNASAEHRTAELPIPVMRGPTAAASGKPLQVEATQTCSGNASWFPSQLISFSCPWHWRCLQLKNLTCPSLSSTPVDPSNIILWLVSTMPWTLDRSPALTWLLWCAHPSLPGYL